MKLCLGEREQKNVPQHLPRTKEQKKTFHSFASAKGKMKSFLQNCLGETKQEKIP